MHLISLSLVVWCSLILGYIFIIIPVHGREELNNELKEFAFEDETKLDRAEIQSLKELMAIAQTTSNESFVADVMGKWQRSPTPPRGRGRSRFFLARERRPRSRSRSRTRGRPRSPQRQLSLVRSPSQSRIRGRPRSPQGRPRLSPLPGPQQRPRSRNGFDPTSRSPPPLKRRKTRNDFDPTTTLLQCSDRNPLSSFTHGVPRELEDDVRQFLGPGPRNVYCGDNINLHQIMQLANSMLPRGVRVFDVQGGKSYAYLPRQRYCRFGEFFESGTKSVNCRYAYRLNRRDSEMALICQCPHVEQYWSAWTPCHYCERSLLNWKAQTKPREPVTIHVGRVYNWGDKPSTPECLALMIKQGFRFLPWNWGTFEQQLNIRNSACQKFLRLIKICKEFRDSFRSTENDINQAIILANMHSAQELKTLCLI